MGFTEWGKWADAQVATGKNKIEEQKTVVSGMDKQEKKLVRWLVVALAVFAVIMILFAVRYCGRPDQVVQQAPVEQVVQQQQVANVDPAVGFIAGMALGTIMSNGMAYDGHNGYYHSGYHGPPRYITKTVIVNRTNVIKPATVAAPAAQTPKVKNPGDAAAEQIRKNDALKARIQADRAARASAPVKTSGFNSFSKSRSSSSSGGSRRR